MGTYLWIRPDGTVYTARTEEFFFPLRSKVPCNILFQEQLRQWGDQKLIHYLTWTTRKWANDKFWVKIGHCWVAIGKTFYGSKPSDTMILVLSTMLDFEISKRLSFLPQTLMSLANQGVWFSTFPWHCCAVLECLFWPFLGNWQLVQMASLYRVVLDRGHWREVVLT